MFGIAPFSALPFSDAPDVVPGLPLPSTLNAPMNRNQQFDFSVDVLQAILWQYNTGPSLISVIQSKQNWYDANQTAFWNDWYTDVFDLRTANDFGCSVWAVILKLPLSIEYLAPTGNNFGFDPYSKNFERGNFVPTVLAPLPLTTAQKRLALQLRYAQLITRGCIPQLNAFLKRIFAALGPAWVIDNLDMTIVYHFDFVLPAGLAFLLSFYDLLPRPAGVAATYTSL